MSPVAITLRGLRHQVAKHMPTYQLPVLRDLINAVAADAYNQGKLDGVNWMASGEEPSVKRYQLGLWQRIRNGS